MTKRRRKLVSVYVCGSHEFVGFPPGSTVSVDPTVYNLDAAVEAGVIEFVAPKGKQP